MKINCIVHYKDAMVDSMGDCAASSHMQWSFLLLRMKSYGLGGEFSRSTCEILQPTMCIEVSMGGKRGEMTTSHDLGPILPSSSSS